MNSTLSSFYHSEQHQKERLLALLANIRDKPVGTMAYGNFRKGFIPGTRFVMRAVGG